MSDEKTLGQVAYEAYYHEGNATKWVSADYREDWEKCAQAVTEAARARGTLPTEPEGVTPDRATTEAFLQSTPGRALTILVERFPMLEARVKRLEEANE